MLAVLAVCLNYETIPIDIDRALEKYAVVRSICPRGSLAYYNYIERYVVEGGQVGRIPVIPTPEHARRMSEIDNGQPDL